MVEETWTSCKKGLFCFHTTTKKGGGGAHWAAKPSQKSQKKTLPERFQVASREGGKHTISKKKGFCEKVGKEGQRPRGERNITTVKRDKNAADVYRGEKIPVQKRKKCWRERNY